MNLDKYINIIERKVIPDMRRVFSVSEEIFQQDFNPTSFIKKSEDDFQETQVKCVRMA